MVRHLRYLRSGAALAPLALIAATPILAQSVDVPVRHAETSSVRAVQFFASQKSKDGLMLAVYGDSPDAKAVTLKAAAAARSAGYPLRGVVFGPRRDDAPSVLEFYADAQLIATFLNPNESKKDAILLELRRGMTEIVQPRRR